MALRAAGGPIIIDSIAGRIIEATGFDATDAALRKAIGQECLAPMRSIQGAGAVEQIGLVRSTRWKLAVAS
jgi:hypothetical protein